MFRANRWIFLHGIKRAKQGWIRDPCGSYPSKKRHNLEIEYFGPQSMFLSGNKQGKMPIRNHNCRDVWQEPQNIFWFFFSQSFFLHFLLLSNLFGSSIDVWSSCLPPPFTLYSTPHKGMSQPVHAWAHCRDLPHFNVLSQVKFCNEGVTTCRGSQ